MVELLQESFNFKLEETDLDMSCVKVIAMKHHPFPEKGRNQDFKFQLMFALFILITSKCIMMAVSKRTSCVLDKPIGFTTLGGSMFTRGKILEHWQEVVTLQKVFQNAISCHYKMIFSRFNL